MTGQPPEDEKKEGISIRPTDLRNNRFVRTVHTNISSNVIIITEDKALICLMNNVHRLRNREAWQTPAGILATLVTVMITAAPTNALGIPKEAWTALGVMATALTLLWLLRDLRRRWVTYSVTPHSVVEMLKTLSDPAARKET
jgi:hypothetical protein